MSVKKISKSEQFLEHFQKIREYINFMIRQVKYYM